MTESKAVMLPKSVTPSRYVLTLSPNLETFVFAGEVEIDIQILQPTNSIVLNAAELEINSCWLINSNNTILPPSKTILEEKSETLTFMFEEDIPVGNAKLKIEFIGELNDRLRGFYRSRYHDGNGKERYLATTQFEATDARRAFPCWDEPSLKASFEVTLIVDSEFAVISNTMEAEEFDEDDGLKRVKFKETPIMSTYLLAFIVGDLKSVEKVADDGTLVRVWATAGKEEQGHFAVETSVKLLSYFNDYFGTPYPLEKLDHLAIPDFAAGAMENWGAVTYREVVLLVDPDQSSAQIRQRVAAIISHEMAHMWFGDLVTMAWWNDLWLNESFASWIGDKAVDSLFPEWEMWTQFVSSDTNNALGLDGLKNSHPIEQEVKDPAEIGQLFDAISYSKGGSILRMLERFLGEDIFREGLRNYIAQHQYQNAVTGDLWTALANASNQPVAEIMDTWVQQTGYPVLDISTIAGGVEELGISQKRFVYENLTNPDEIDETIWHIPLTITTSNGEETGPVLMDDRAMTVTLGKDSGDDWLKINPDQVGFYRVNYSTDGWAQLQPAVSKLEISAIDRLGLQNDAFALSRAGYLSVTQFLALVKSYINETNAIVWEDVAANLARLDLLLSDEIFYSTFAEMARHIYLPAGDQIGWDPKPGEKELDSIMRSTLLGQLGKYNHEATLKEAWSKFSIYSENPDAVHPDIRGVVFNLASKQGDAATYNTIWELHDRTTMEEEKMRLLMSLGNFEKLDLLSETLDRSLSDQVRYHDTILVVSSVASNRLGRDMAWEFVKNNWAEFDRRYSDGLFALSRLVNITARFTTDEKLEDVERFFKENPTPAADRAINQALETIRLNIAWLRQNRSDLSSFFTN